jgi:plasmid stabilization system protein ParE
MRRAIFAPSFDREVEDIGVAIEERFGKAVRREFLVGLRQACALVVSFPGIGKRDHGYETSILELTFRLNWIFFEYDAEQVRFLHIRDGRLNKDDQTFAGRGSDA